MTDFIRAAWPVIAALLALAFLLAIRRYLFATHCWRCGTALDARTRVTYLWKFIPRIYCRRCGSKTIKFTAR